MDKFNDLENFKPAIENYIFNSDAEKILVIRENGIIRVWDWSELPKDDKWIYKQEDISKRITFVDIDINSVKPIVKSILNEVANFPEIIMLNQIRIGLVVILIVASVSLFLDYKSFKQEDAKMMYETITKGLLQAGTMKVQPMPVQTGSIIDNF